MLLQLSLCVVTVIQLTSSQSTYDVNKDQNDVNSCVGSEQVLSQLVTAVSHIQVALTQLQRNVAELKSFNQENATSQMQALTQLQRDTAQLKSFNRQEPVEGMPVKSN